jgi:type IX secretion system PorP/SprF family membrane protein
MNGGPTLGSFSFQTPVDKSLAIGVAAINDTKGLISTSMVSFTGSYSISLAETQALRFGLSVGGGWNRLDLDQLRIVTPNDPALNSALNSNFQIVGNAGMSYHTQTFHFGFSLPRIFEPVYVSAETFNVSIKPFQTVIIHTSNRFYFSKSKNVFEPYLVYRLRTGLPSQIEAAALVHLQNKGWVGASYRQDFGVSAMAGFKLNKQSAISYSYSVGSGGDTGIGRPSHEIHVALLLGEHKRGTPMYSFLDTDKEKKKKTPQELAAEKKKQQEALAAEKKKKEEEVLAAENKKKEEAAAVALAAEQRKQEEQRQRDEARARHDQQVRDSLVVAHTHEEEQEKLKRLEEEKNKPDSARLHNDAAPRPRFSNAPDPAERHEFVKRGTHTDEMDLADYVIVGAFRGKENAQRFTTGLKAMGYKDTDFGFISARNIWYVYIASGNDLVAVKEERDKYRKITMFKDAWLLTVHE